MASSVDFILNLNGDQARKVLLDLHRQGNSLFSKTGYDLRLNNKGFNRSLDQATDRVLSFTAATTIFSTVGLAMRRLASDAITVETSIAQIQSILNATSGDLSGFTDSLFKLANKTGVGFSDAAKAAEEFSRQGLTLEKTLKATEAALSLARVSGGNLEKTVGNLVSITSAFANEALVFEDVADTLGALDAAFSTTTTGLAEGLSRVSAVANGVGVSFKEMASLIAATKQVTGRSEAVIGNAFKSIFTNIGTDAVQNELRAIGVETRNLDGTFIDAEKVIASLAARYDDLTDAQRANISFKVAGKYNKNILEGAIFAQNQGVSEKALNVAESSAGSIAERLAVLNNTTATSLQTLQNSITKLSTGEIGGLFTQLTKEAATFAQKFVDGVVKIFEEGNPVGKALAGGIAGVLKGPVLAIGLTLIGKLIQKVGQDLLRAGKSVFGANSGFQSQRSILMQINDEILRGNTLLAQRVALAAGKNAKTGGTSSTSSVNPAYFPNTIAGGGRFAPNTTPYLKPNIKDPKYRRSINITSQPSTAIPTNYLSDRILYNKRMAAQAAQNAAGQKKFNQGKLARIDAYRNTPLQGGFFGIAKREKAFARTQGVSENQKAVNERITLSRQGRSDKIRGGAFGASFIAPVIGSSLNQAIGGKGGKIAEDVGNAASIAALGLAMGGIAAPLAAAVAGFKIFSSITETIFGDYKELNKVLSDNVAEIQKNVEAGSAYVAAQRAYNDALKDGDANLILKTGKDLTGAASDLKGDRRKLIQLSNPEDQQKLLNELDKSSEAVQNASIAAATANNLMAESYKGTLEQFGANIGVKKSLESSKISPVADAIAKALDISKIGDLTGVQSRFVNTGNSQEIQSLIGGLVANIPELSAAFKTASEAGVGATEQLSLLTLSALASRQSNEDLAESTRELQKSSQDLTVSFRENISRVFDTTEQIQKTRRSATGDKIAVAEILGGGAGDKITQLTNKFNLSESSAQNLAGGEKDAISGTFVKSISEILEKSTKNASEKLKANDFLEVIGQAGYDFSNFMSDFRSQLGDIGFAEVEKENLKYADELNKKIQDEARASATRKAIYEAEKAVLQRSRSARAFGSLTESPDEAVSIASKGRKAENRVNQFIKGILTPSASRGSLKNFSDEDALDVIAKAEAEKAAGKPISGNKVAIETAFTRRTEINQKTGASSEIQDAIDNAINQNKIYNKDRGLTQSLDSERANKNISEEIQKKIQIGDYSGAEKLAGGLQVQDKSGVISAIQSQGELYKKIPETAKAAREELMGDPVKPLNENTSAIKALTEAITAKTDPSDISKNQKESLLREQKRGVVANSLEKNILVPLNQRESERNSIFNTKASLGEFVKSKSTSQPPVNFGGGSVRIEPTEKDITNRQDIELVQQAYSEFRTFAERLDFMAKEVGPERASKALTEAKSFIDPKNEGVGEGVKISRQERVEKDINYLKEQKVQAEKQLAVLDAFKGSSVSLEDSVKKATDFVKNLSEVFSKGIVQTVNTNVGVDVTGSAPGSNKDFMDGLAVLIKPYFEAYYKEATGKNANLIPTSK